MPTEIIGLYGAITGDTQNAATTADIPHDAVITGIDWDCEVNLDADDERVVLELSFIATNQISSNDVRGRISSISGRMSLTTSGVAFGALNKYVGPLDLIVAGGERIYVHVVSATGASGTFRCNVHLDSARPSQRRSARRR